MPIIEYRNNTLHMESVSLADVANQFGTPCYTYSAKAITDAYQAYATALGDWPGLICYAIKANSNLGVLNLLAKLGAGFDIVSLGELERVLRAGGQPGKIVFSGVGKTPEEMIRALEVGIKCFNVESEAELETLSETAETIGKTANISLRVNPDVDAKTHPYISTGLKENKFGIDIKRALSVYQRAQTLPGIRVVGVDCHIGSQLTEITPFLDALERVIALVDTLDEHGISIEHIDLGGGLGVVYQDETPPDIADYIAALKDKLSGRNIELMFEPGRSIVANAGVLLTKVLYLKPTEEKNFAIIDAAMNDNIRPSLYQAWQDIVPVNQKTSTVQEWDLVGPICETGDFLGKNRRLSIEQGDLLAVKSTGAYGFTMSSNYNSRPRVAEVIIDDTKAHLVRRRETIEELYQGESLLPDN